MNVMLLVIIVITKLVVVTQRDPLSAHVTMVILEMELLALVIIPQYYMFVNV